MLARVVGVGLFALAIGLAQACAADEAKLWFDQAVRAEVLGGASAAADAVALYRRAAMAGLPEAEFNTAIMLDSGRGVARDVAQAATWYARAAAHGHQRAAYNLGQLYLAGDGVPANVDLARAWFADSNLTAARARLAKLADKPAGGAALVAPTPVAPADGAHQISETGGLELVWTSAQQAEPVAFLVEIRAVDAAGSHEVFSGVTTLSSFFAILPDTKGDFAWRVTAIARKAARYVPGRWSRFSLTSQPMISAQ